MADIKKEPMSMILELQRMFDGFLRIEMKKNGMKSSYRHLLSPLAIKDGVTQLDLVKASHLKAPTVSTTLRNMEEEGLVSRETDKDDARATRVYITEKGKAIDQKMRESIDTITSAFMKGISAQDKKAAAEVMLKMYDNVKEVGSRVTYD